LLTVDSLKLASAVYRVHWLKSRAQLHRWEEELILTKHEMVWTTGYFIHKSVEWQKWADGAAAAGGTASGKAAYAHKQVNLWKRLAMHADSQYVLLYPQYSQLSS
jgi:hypothetical protein